ncbi:4-alpha-glucanotransferase [Trichothermofontia sichuanensis B231]|uniref:4-alpha-glucanotransferase n=1 Tax=Trichothermofontia sichuanensis TaxID=3045816 RepID=UPI0022468A8D|nr:4-alpha-glucanotransferase [Trichothermofontia sichuanensis]UZQ53121.1 4-alpha-glucanotransferase [Trichothermofontia sichuanensis B231]
MPFPRASGILLHPTSFPSRFGIGDLGPGAYTFIDFLANAKQQLWQVLPLGPTGFGNSPYMCYSALAGNPLLISPELLRDQGLLNNGDLDQYPHLSPDRVDYEAVERLKYPLFRRAFENFQARNDPTLKSAFAAFCQQHASWLDDYALFMALKDVFKLSWNQWDKAIAWREPSALAHWKSELQTEIQYRQFLQFEFFRQWADLRRYANERGIRIIGDIPIYVAHDSSDVWANPKNFRLDEATGEAAEMAGVPPDVFSETGQLWGNPIYNWDYQRQQGFQWWVQRFQSLLEFVDVIRVDHFRGFSAYWAVPQGEKTAMNGKWVDAPGHELFQTLRDRLGGLPIVAEDLGIITPDVEELRDRFEFPGMKILLFAFDSGSDNPYLPFQYIHNCIVYTGTHDNNTTIGWFNEAEDWKRQAFERYLGRFGHWGIHWDMIRLALSSVADWAILPLQDVMGLGGEARMNFPGTSQGNWVWRYRSEMLNSEMGDRLRHMTEIYGRAPR